jgi:hypothetical protein
LHKYLKLLRGKDCQLKALIDQTLYNKAFRRKAESLCNNAVLSRKFENQATELLCQCAMLNRMIQLGKPVSVPVAA